MTPSILINTASGSAPWVAQFTVEEPPRTLFQKGLAGVEAAVIQFLARDVDPSDAVEADWVNYQVDGVTMQLDAGSNLRALYARGVYRVKVAAAAAASQIGVY